MFILAIAATSVFAQAPTPAPSPLIVKYANVEFQSFKRRESYFIDLMVMALDRAGVPYKMVPVNLDSPTENRSVHYVQNDVYSVHWLNTSKQLEEELLPVRVPLFKGLIGWRLLLVRKSEAHLFKRVKTAEDLKTFKVLQGDDWPDTLVLENQGFNVVTSSDFDSLFRMLNRGRGDIFPRAVTEVWEDLESYSGEGTTVEEHLVLRYPAAYYFFVDRSNLALRNALEKGLDIAIRDGSFDKLFNRYFGDIVARSRLEERRIISLPNTNMSDETPLHRRDLWMDVE